MKVAAIDLGTNTFLCLVARVKGSGSSAKIEVIKDCSRVVRLGEKVNQNRAFLPEALARAEVCLKEFANIIKESGAEKIVATATSAARDAKNGHELLQLGERLGIPIEVIGGKREAELSFYGTMSGFPAHLNKQVLVVDVGGGSTELIRHSPGQPLQAQSFDVGVVRLTEMFVKSDPIKESEYEELRAYGKQVLQKFGKPPVDHVIGVAGTPTTLACIVQAIAFDDEKINGFSLTREQIDFWGRKLGAMTLDLRKQTTGLEPKRADVIVAGCALLDAALEIIGHSEMIVSTRGLRFGAAMFHESFRS
ncbi:MAG: Ppx/GppA family phosphatase [Oligoflexia bacterium]|nr:Ppx/GppA family phosphatase [Oligoflexia bacterium]